MNASSSSDIERSKFCQHELRKIFKLDEPTPEPRPLIVRPRKATAATFPGATHSQQAQNVYNRPTKSIPEGLDKAQIQELIRQGLQKNRGVGEMKDDGKQNAEAGETTQESTSGTSSQLTVIQIGNKRAGGFGAQPRKSYGGAYGGRVNVVTASAEAQAELRREEQQGAGPSQTNQAVASPPTVKPKKTKRAERKDDGGGEDVAAGKSRPKLKRRVRELEKEVAELKTRLAALEQRKTD